MDATPMGSRWQRYNDVGTIGLSPEEAVNLRLYLEKGGFLLGGRLLGRGRLGSVVA